MRAMQELRIQGVPSNSAVDAGDADELERAWLAALATGCPGDLIATGGEAGFDPRQPEARERVVSARKSP